MPLLDHFHPPLSLRHRWESFHTYWAVAMAERLNRELPAGRYFVEVRSHVGSRVEADVAEYEAPDDAAADGNPGGVAVQTYSPPAATMVLPAVFPDDIEVQVLDARDGARLVGVV